MGDAAVMMMILATNPLRPNQETDILGMARFQSASYFLALWIRSGKAKWNCVISAAADWQADGDIADCSRLRMYQYIARSHRITQPRLKPCP